MARAFASSADMGKKKVTFEKIGEGCYSYSAEGDPTSGVIVGDDAVMVIDTRATPTEAQDLIKRVRRVTKKPIRYVVLTHYHAVRVLGASAYNADHVICSEETLRLIRERGKQDFKSEVDRFPRLFDDVASVPGLTWPTLTFRDSMTLWLGKMEVQIIHAGKGHTSGDTIVWCPKQRVLFSGDLVENAATPYTGDAYLREWPKTLQRLRNLKPKVLVPGRGDATKTARSSLAAIDSTERFITALYRSVARGAKARKELRQVYQATYGKLAKDYGTWPIFDHCMPFDVSRAYDEASGIEVPRIWTAKRDKEMWRALEG